MGKSEATARELEEHRRRLAELEDELRIETAARKRAEKRLQEVLSMVSHRLRTPLAGLVGLTELLLEREYPADKQRYFLTALHAEARRLTDLLDELLELPEPGDG